MATGSATLAGRGHRGSWLLRVSPNHRVRRRTAGLHFRRLPPLRQAPALGGEDSGVSGQNQKKHRPRHRKAADEVHRRLREGIQRRPRAERSDILLIVPVRNQSSTGFSSGDRDFRKTRAAQGSRCVRQNAGRGSRRSRQKTDFRSLLHRGGATDPRSGERSYHAEA